MKIEINDEISKEQKRMQIFKEIYFPLPEGYFFDFDKKTIEEKGWIFDVVKIADFDFDIKDEKIIITLIFTDKSDVKKLHSYIKQISYKGDEGYEVEKIIINIKEEDYY